MANLLSLIKLRKHSVDEKQKVLAQLYREAEALQSKKDMLIDRLREERMALNEKAPLEMFTYFGRYSQNVQRVIERFTQEIVKIETRIQVAQDDVREAFAGMKRIEIVQAEREKEEKKIQADKESNEMDEIGLDGYRRNQEEN